MSNAIDMELVKQLRGETLIGIKECKNALVESGGNLEGAKKILKMKGRMNVNARVQRKTESGSVFCRCDSRVIAMVLLACESDSVASTDVFESAGNQMTKIVVETGRPRENDEIRNILKDLMSVLKENISIRNIELRSISENEYSDLYVHDEGKIAAWVKLKSQSSGFLQNELIKVLAHDLAIHICAAQPQYIDCESVNTEVLKEYREIFDRQAEGIENIDEKVREKIVRGKLKKNISSLCLLEQGFVKSPGISVGEMIRDVEIKTGIDVEIVDFICLQV